MSETKDGEAIKGTITRVQGKFEEGLAWPRGQREKKWFETYLEDRVKCSREAH